MTSYGLTMLALWLVASSPAAAATLSGTVRNRTTGKPAAGDEVVLLSATGGATEIGRGRTDARGHFAFAVDDTQAPRLVRVIHQRLAYHRIAPAGAGPVEVLVYDAAETLEGLTAALDVRLQSQGGALEVIDEIVVSNASYPPRTLMNARPLEIQLPLEAEIVGGAVQAGGGNRIKQRPIPSGEKGWYYYPFPLPPGETRFAVAYRLPFQGEAMIDPRLSYPLTRLVVVLPKSMKFEAQPPGMFQGTPGEGASVRFVGTVKPGQSSAFRVSGTGTLLAAGSGKRQARGDPQARLGGSLEAPVDLRDSLRSLRWVVLGGLALVMAACVAGLLGHKRKQPQRLSA